MARKTKSIVVDGIDKREVGYYSTPKFVADYIASEMLKLNPEGKKVLDPAVGKEELIDAFYNEGKDIQSYDIISYKDYKKSNFTQSSFLEFYKNIKSYGDIFADELSTDFDYMIANPPYNCHEVDYIKKNKDWLKRLFPIGIYNMYSMFLSAMIDMAKEGCVIGVIISDSFLTATYHSKLRDQIFNTCSVHQILLCPANLFWDQKADVRTCILILQKGRRFQKNIKIANRPQNIDEFKQNLENHITKEVKLKDIRLNCGNQIIIDVDNSIVKLFTTFPLLGECFKCVTCISTGDDKKYLRSAPCDGYSVPFYKNPASRKFISSPDAYLIDDYLVAGSNDKNFMVRNKALLNKEGIVCSSMGLPFSAAYLPQDAVSGVNPTIFPHKKDILWLISYLNSSLVTYIVRGVIIRSNMITSGYVSCIPILEFTDEEKKFLSNIALKASTKKQTIEDCIIEIDNLIKKKSIIPNKVYDDAITFSHNLGKCV